MYEYEEATGRKSKSGRMSEKKWQLAVAQLAVAVEANQVRAVIQLINRESRTGSQDEGFLKLCTPFALLIFLKLEF